MKAPIDGMRREPEGEEYMAPAFVACVRWALGNADARAAFTSATGKDLDALLGRTALAAAIDRSTGREREMFGAFADWVSETIWG